METMAAHETDNFVMHWHDRRLPTHTLAEKYPISTEGVLPTRFLAKVVCIRKLVHARGSGNVTMMVLASLDPTCGHPALSPSRREHYCGHQFSYAAIFPKESSCVMATQNVEQIRWRAGSGWLWRIAGIKKQHVCIRVGYR
uniref:Uncharacterized protein n=1 Tax=Bionectria ochroleuca TaxID=29856 RepID=A0A8H7N7S6_BIOOC